MKVRKSLCLGFFSSTLGRVIILCAPVYAISSSDPNTCIKFCAFLCFSIYAQFDFSCFPDGWKIINAAIHMYFNAFVGLHHYCTFFTVVCCPAVNDSLLCCFPWYFFHQEKYLCDQFMIGVSSNAADIMIFQN